MSICGLLLSSVNGSNVMIYFYPTWATRMKLLCFFRELNSFTLIAQVQRFGDGGQSDKIEPAVC